MSILSVITGLGPRLYIEAAVAAALVSAVGVQTVRLDRAEEEIYRNFSIFEAQTENAEKAALAQSQANRAEEQRRTAAQKEIVDATIQQAAVVASDAAAARDSHERLLQRVAAVAAPSRPSPGNPQAPSISASAAGPGLVLANVLGRIDARAGQLAEFADQARTAGLACERSYDTLNP